MLLITSCGIWHKFQIRKVTRHALVDLTEAELPPLHVKLGLMKKLLRPCRKAMKLLSA
jgi:hypothetical protein